MMGMFFVFIMDLMLGDHRISNHGVKPYLCGHFIKWTDIKNANAEP
jgi:hypothetical protein